MNEHVEKQQRKQLNLSFKVRAQSLKWHADQLPEYRTKNYDVNET